MLCWGFGSHYWLSPTSVGVKIGVSACPTLTGDRLSASRTTPLLHWKVLIDYWSIPSYPFVRYDISNSIVSPFQLSLITTCIHSITKIIPVSDHLSCSVVSLFEKFYFLFQNVPICLNIDSLPHWGFKILSLCQLDHSQLSCLHFRSLDIPTGWIYTATNDYEVSFFF